jgi:hypothetical protein
VIDEEGESKTKILKHDAASRFQMNMRMLGSVRECAQWITEVEIDTQEFFDVVVRYAIC